MSEGGKKIMYLAHDTFSKRDVAFAPIKTKGLRETALTERLSEPLGLLLAPCTVLWAWVRNVLPRSVANAPVIGIHVRIVVPH